MEKLFRLRNSGQCMLDRSFQERFEDSVDKPVPIRIKDLIIFLVANTKYRLTLF